MLRKERTVMIYQFNANLNQARDTVLSAYYDLILLSIGFEFVSAGMISKDDKMFPAGEWILGLDNYPYQIKAYVFSDNILLTAKDLKNKIDYFCRFDLIMSKTINKFKHIPDQANPRRQIIAMQLNKVIDQINQRLKD